MTPPRAERPPRVQTPPALTSGITYRPRGRLALLRDSHSWPISFTTLLYENLSPDGEVETKEAADDNGPPGFVTIDSPVAASGEIDDNMLAADDDDGASFDGAQSGRDAVTWALSTAIDTSDPCYMADENRKSAYDSGEVDEMLEGESEAVVTLKRLMTTTTREMNMSLVPFSRYLAGCETRCWLQQLSGATRHVVGSYYDRVRADDS